MTKEGWTVMAGAPYQTHSHPTRFWHQGVVGESGIVGEGIGSSSSEAGRNAALIAAAPDLLEACKAQHQAMDLLFALLVDAKADFFPSRSAAWPAMVAGSAAIKKAEGRS